MAEAGRSTEAVRREDNIPDSHTHNHHDLLGNAGLGRSFVKKGMLTHTYLGQ